MHTEYIFPAKSKLRKIKTTDITYPVPDLKNCNSSKAETIAGWLAAWIDADISLGNIKANDLLPAKSEFAYFLGVSVGTVQNALRYAEDAGYVESKQRIGTMIKDRSQSGSVIRKLTSKREIAIIEIKNFILNNKYKAGQILPSSRTLAALIGCSANTTRLALGYLCTSGILIHKKCESKDNVWIVKSVDFEKKNITSNCSARTLVEKVENDLKSYINENLNAGDKLPSHAELSSYLKVSMKTVHDALKNLINDGILLARRGRYGTVVLKLPKDVLNNSQRFETSIFAPAKDTAFYYYEKTQNAIKSMISEHYEVGSRLPSIIELSKEMDLSPNTIRKAFHNLAKEGYIIFTRGRYGGTFVVDIPEISGETFKWLAVNPQFAKLYNK